MPSQPISSARAVLRLNGTIIAYAQGGGRVLDRFDNKNLTKLKLYNLILTEEGLRLFPASDFEEALAGKAFEIEIRNSNGSVTLFRNCNADISGRSETPKIATFDSVDFYTFDAP